MCEAMLSQGGKARIKGSANKNLGRTITKSQRIKAGIRPSNQRLDEVSLSDGICEASSRLSGLPRRNSYNCIKATIHVCFGGCPRRNTDAHGGATLPDCPAAPTRSIALNRLDDPFRHVRLSERNKHLIQYDVI